MPLPSHDCLVISHSIGLIAPFLFLISRLLVVNVLFSLSFWGLQRLQLLLITAKIRPRRFEGSLGHVRTAQYILRSFDIAMENCPCIDDDDSNMIYLLETR